jgi:hypothetical protein
MSTESLFTGLYGIPVTSSVTGVKTPPGATESPNSTGLLDGEAEFPDLAGLLDEDVDGAFFSLTTGSPVST